MAASEAIDGVGAPNWRPRLLERNSQPSGRNVGTAPGASVTSISQSQWQELAIFWPLRARLKRKGVYKAALSRGDWQGQFSSHDLDKRAKPVSVL